MDTDERPDFRRGGESKPLLKAETEKIIGFAFAALNEIAHRLPERVFENAQTVFKTECYDFKSVFIWVRPWLKLNFGT